MIKERDTVKVIAATRDANNPGMETEYIPIGTVCTVIQIDIAHDGKQCFLIDSGDGYCFWYLENELEKGHMEWVKNE